MAEANSYGDEVVSRVDFSKRVDVIVLSSKVAQPDLYAIEQLLGDFCTLTFSDSPSKFRDLIEEKEAFIVVLDTGTNNEDLESRLVIAHSLRKSNPTMHIILSGPDEQAINNKLNDLYGTGLHQEGNQFTSRDPEEIRKIILGILLTEAYPDVYHKIE